MKKTLKESREIKSVISQLTNYKQLWLDTEIADWNTANPTLSLIQVLAHYPEKTGERVVILDVLDRPNLITEFIEQIMVNPHIEKIFHNASFDLKYLGKDRAENITCSLKIAKKISKKKLGAPNLKLKTLAEKLCHFENVNTEPQGSDWGKRPLNREQLYYAKMDVVYLANVHQYLINFTSSKQLFSTTYKPQLSMNNSTNSSLSVTQVRVAFECPRLFYLNYHVGGKTLFIPPNNLQGIGTIFHKQAEEFINCLQTEPEFRSVFKLPVEQLKIETIASQMQQLFYQLKFFPYLQTTIRQKPDRAAALHRVWLGLTSLIKQWAELLIRNRNYCHAESVIESTFIEQEKKFEYDFTLPNGNQQKLVGKFDSLINDLAKRRPCVVEYKTYQPVDPSSQLAQVALYSYILGTKTHKINDSAVYCVLPEFKVYYYCWEHLENTVHQLIPNKLQQMNQWIGWQQGKPDVPPPTTSPHLCQICPQQKKCQTFFQVADEEDKPLQPIQPSKLISKPNPQPSIDADKIGQKLVEILQSYSLNVSYQGAAVGSTFIRIKLKPDLGVKVVSIANRTEDLKVHLGISTPPLIATQAGYISVDVPRKDRQVLNFYDYVKQQNNSVNTAVKIALGIDLEGKLIEADLADSNTCHFLVGGTTGSGKSEFLRSLLLSLLYCHSPQQLRIALVDPKRVTFPEFESMPWLLAPVVKDSEAAITLMENLVTEMGRRYRLFEVNKCPHLDAYNQKQIQQGQAPEPRIVCIFDEYADFMVEKATRNSLEESIKRLGAMARAAGIHLIVATQRPEAKVVNPIIRSNLPGRIALRTASEADSKIILGGTRTEGAYLLGKGDSFYQVGTKLQRLQSLFADRVKLPNCS